MQSHRFACRSAPRSVAIGADVPPFSEQNYTTCLGRAHNINCLGGSAGLESGHENKDFFFLRKYGDGLQLPITQVASLPFTGQSLPSPNYVHNCSTE